MDQKRERSLGERWSDAKASKTVVFWACVATAVLTMIIGFSWGGWMTSSGADRLATDRSRTAVTTALVPVCLEKSKSDPAVSRKLVVLKALPSSYDQREAVLNDGWASIGSGEANRDVADACASELLKAAAK